MGEINIVFTRRIEPELLDRIRELDSRIRVIDASELAYAEDKGDFSKREKLDLLLCGAEIICGFWPPRDVLIRAPRLKWFHTLLAGVDRPEFREIFRSHVILTNSAGIHGTQVSECAFMLILSLAKGAPLFFRMQQEKKWSPAVPTILEGKTLGILGLGNIGRAIARLGKAFGMRVIAIRRSVKEPTQEENVDLVMPVQSLMELLSQSDFVVISLPATAETEKIIGVKELRAMKRTAYVVNVARGKIIDEGALIEAIREGWIAGAGLDTVEVEPLPPSSDLWELPNVIITPHVSGRRKDYNRLAVPIFCENLKRYLNGQVLINLVDKQRGY